MTTFVLVHGNYHGGWCWQKVAPRLRAEGHDVLTPTLTGVGERAHLLTLLGTAITSELQTQDVVGVLDAGELDDVVLVAHSAGGVPVHATARRRADRLRALVYLDSAYLPPGMTQFDVQDETTTAAHLTAAEALGGIATPVPEPAYFDVHAPDDQAWLSRRLTPQPLEPRRTAPDVLPDDQEPLMPTVFVGCLRSRYLSAVKTQADANPRARWAELDAGHDVMVSEPAAVVELLLDIAA